MKKLLSLTALVILPLLVGAQEATVQDFKILVPTRTSSGANNELALLDARVLDAFTARDYDLSLNILDQILAIDPNNLPALANEAAVHTTRGVLMYNVAVFDTDLSRRKVSM